MHALAYAAHSGSQPMHHHEPRDPASATVEYSVIYVTASGWAVVVT
jgi:hypothetical protein